MAPITADAQPDSSGYVVSVWATERGQSVRSSPSAAWVGRKGAGHQVAKAPSEGKREPYALDWSQHPGSLDVQLTRRIGARASSLAVEPNLAPTMVGFVHCTACHVSTIWFIHSERSMWHGRPRFRRAPGCAGRQRGSVRLTLEYEPCVTPCRRFPAGRPAVGTGRARLERGPAQARTRVATVP